MKLARRASLLCVLIAFAVTAAAPVAARAGARGEGIQVHGHWVIEVRDPDGTLRDRREFDNALVGPQVLANLLTRQTTSVGAWAIGAGGTHLCATTWGDGNPVVCNFIENGGAPDLRPKIELRGNDVNVSVNATAAAIPWTLTYVGTAIGSEWFTKTTLPSPIDVAVGQTVRFDVTISFCCPPTTPQ